ncbi:hypothetical protein F7725_017769 [Dissostichus mawsoni]|uniref:Uncharacterized protein n=1 Tax=Dissostichus mawsoni TaxID=36200 RepID=A0A7J5XPP8_DISMA|nr:hypothetical protein F7725_017769 [Dissostichus mawsoni]
MKMEESSDRGPESRLVPEPYICQGSTPSVYDSESERNNPRYRYLGDKEGNCSLQISGLQEEDDATLRFRVETNPSSGTGGHLVQRRRPSQSGPALSALTAKDSGNYTCALKNDARTKSLPFRLHVEAADKDGRDLLPIIVPVVCGVLLAVFLLLFFIIRRRRAAAGAAEEEQQDVSRQRPDDVHFLPPAEEEVSYAAVQFRAVTSGLRGVGGGGRELRLGPVQTEEPEPTSGGGRHHLQLSGSRR